MEEVMSIIFHGMKLVDELKSSLQEKSPESLSTSLDEITKTFDDAKERLRIVLVIRNSETAMNQVKPVISSCSDRMLMQIEPDLMQEYWLRYGGSTSSHGTEAVTQRQLMAVDGDGGRNLTATERSGGSGSAKKQVQRLNEDPFTFRVTYRGSHTCHIYSTAPTASAAAPTAPITTTATTSHPVDYGPFFDMAEAMMLGSGGIGDNMDFIFPCNDPPHHHHCYRRQEDGDGDK
ncbi:hypothetical protein YC2023_036582 [Brassica napus]